MRATARRPEVHVTAARYPSRRLAEGDPEGPAGWRQRLTRGLTGGGGLYRHALGIRLGLTVTSLTIMGWSVVLSTSGPRSSL